MHQPTNERANSPTTGVGVDPEEKRHKKQTPLRFQCPYDSGVPRLLAIRELRHGNSCMSAMHSAHCTGTLAFNNSRWIAPDAQTVALHALVCLLSAAKVDKFDAADVGVGHNNTTNAWYESSDAEGGRLVLAEEAVLLLVLQACEVFRGRHEVVTACCMLMTLGARFSSPVENCKTLKAREVSVAK